MLFERAPMRVALEIESESGLLNARQNRTIVSYLIGICNDTLVYDDRYFVAGDYSLLWASDKLHNSLNRELVRSEYSEFMVFLFQDEFYGAIDFLEMSGYAQEIPF